MYSEFGNVPASAVAKQLLLAEVAEQRFQDAFILAAGRGRRTADEVKHLAILKTVIGDSFDCAALAEIHGNDLPVFFGWREKRRLPHLAGDIIECVAAADDGGGRGRTECGAHLLLAHAGLNGLQVGIVKLVAMNGNYFPASRQHERGTESDGGETRRSHRLWGLCAASVMSAHGRGLSGESLRSHAATI